jgi:hypothetical protein
MERHERASALRSTAQQSTLIIWAPLFRVAHMEAAGCLPSVCSLWQRIDYFKMRWRGLFGISTDDSLTRRVNSSLVSPQACVMLTQPAHSVRHAYALAGAAVTVTHARPGTTLCPPTRKEHFRVLRLVPVETRTRGGGGVPPLLGATVRATSPADVPLSDSSVGQSPQRLDSCARSDRGTSARLLLNRPCKLELRVTSSHYL